jgi:hypothetical protein
MPLGGLVYATLLHHRAECGQSVPPVRVVPQPKGVGVALYTCISCGAIATSTKSVGRG